VLLFSSSIRGICVAFGGMVLLIQMVGTESTLAILEVWRSPLYECLKGLIYSN
jgi:hypothetical protein